MTWKIRVILVAAACLGVTGVSRFTFHGTKPTLATNTTSEDHESTAHDLLLNAGYMVAVG